MKFRYVGQKTDGERAFRELTGIEWFPGDVKDVENPEACAQMVKHPTVWECLGDAATIPAPQQVRPPVNAGHIDDDTLLDSLEEQDEARRAAKATPSTELAAGAPDGSTIPVADLLDKMSDETVRDLAKRHGVTFKGIALTKGANLRAKVLAALEAKG